MHKQPLIKKLLRYTRNLLIFFFASTLLAVIIYRFMPVYEYELKFYTPELRGEMKFNPENGALMEKELKYQVR